jgi:hypothetical protein
VDSAADAREHEPAQALGALNAAALGVLFVLLILGVGLGGWQLGLTLFGAAAELSGISLVILDVREARSHAVAVMSKKTSVAVFAGIARWPRQPIAVASDALSAEQRFDRLEQALAASDSEVDRQIDLVEKVLREECWGLVAQARQHVEERDTALRGVLADQLDAGVGRRWLGAVLFTLGLAAQTAANIIGIG